jgi:TolA-binding protein
VQDDDIEEKAVALCTANNAARGQSCVKCEDAGVALADQSSVFEPQASGEAQTEAVYVVECDDTCLESCYLVQEDDMEEKAMPLCTANNAARGQSCVKCDTEELIPTGTTTALQQQEGEGEGEGEGLGEEVVSVALAVTSVVSIGLGGGVVAMFARRKMSAAKSAHEEAVKVQEDTTNKIREDLESQLRNLRSEIDSLKEEEARLKGEVRQLRDSKDEAVRTLREKEKEHQDFKQKADRDIRAFKSSSEEAHAKAAALKDRLDKFAIEEKSLREKIGIIESEKQSVEKNLQKTQEMLTAAYAARHDPRSGSAPPVRTREQDEKVNFLNESP